MSSGSDTPSHPAPPPPSAPDKITPRDVASATAVGAATRLGMARRKAGTAGAQPLDQLGPAAIEIAVNSSPLLALWP